MIVKRDRRLELGLASILLAGLSACTSGMEDAAKQELKANPVAGTPAAQMQQQQQAAAAAANATLPAPVDPNVPTEPAPIVPGTATPAPIPTFKIVALGTAATTPTAMAMAAGEEKVAMQTAAMPASPDAVTSLPMSTDTADPAILPPEVTVAQTIVPTAKPAGAALAYAAPSATTSLAALDNQFDVSAPAAVQTLELEADKPETTGPTVINALIKKYAAIYQMPEALIHRVVKRESTYKPSAYNNGHYGLMQIKYSTAKSMGYEGPASGLFDAETNLKYAIKYLKGAWLVADNSHDQAVNLYARGYYYDAKRKGMLHVLQP
ncbi:lytic transglycosylase domain-containing protein [Rhizobium sp. S-51]|uniref:Lytic transglycosylase domain-containing protein n=1 Tax=Rhizobium terricola TaxID=2728849 RepID=A0A7Y0FU99_9HYPH|nr:lytic transglycosylase domain-containing protein [Rhizobium terricola]NML73138.1 lytic transglycosylase domain-containing protein [Rhizobium terricola]